MKKLIATLIAGLFATAAFAQTPAPTTPAPAGAASTTVPAIVKADATAGTKQETKTVTKAAKHTKKVAHHKPMVRKDSSAASDTPAPAPAAAQ